MDAKILLDEEITQDGDRLVRALLELRGKAPADDERRAPIDLALVLDRSGSMGGGKLAAAKRAAAGLVRRLSPRDRVGVVAYDDTVTTIAEPATGDAQEDLAARIESITTGGTTNLSGGWLRGREMVGNRVTGEQGDRETGAIHRVILLTDGLANVGITDPGQLTGLAAHAARDGITTTTIGFGSGFNEDLLKAMADAGGGSTYYIEAADQAGDVFAEELEGLLALAGQNVRVAITPAGEHVGSMLVRHDFPSSAEGATLKCELGDLYAREPKRLLVQALVRLDDAETTAVFEVVVDADVVREDGGIEHRTVKLPVVVSRTAGPSVNPEVKREALLLDAADARRKALEAERRGDYDDARVLLRETSARIIACAPPGDDELREQADDLGGMAAHLEQAGAFSASDAKYLAQREYDVRRSKRAMYDKISRVRREKRPE